MQINRLHLFVSQCITEKTVKVVKAKKTPFVGGGGGARAGGRNLDFTFVKEDDKVRGSDCDSRSPCC